MSNQEKNVNEAIADEAVEAGEDESIFMLTMVECMLTNDPNTSDEEFGRMIRQRIRKELYKDAPK